MKKEARRTNVLIFVMIDREYGMHNVLQLNYEPMILSTCDACCSFDLCVLYVVCGQVVCFLFIPYARRTVLCAVGTTNVKCIENKKKEHFNFDL